MREEGKSFKEIAAALGVTPPRASVLCKSYQKVIDEASKKQEPQWHDGLSHRAAKLLISAGYTDKASVVNDLMTEKISKGYSRDTTTPGIGITTLKELYKWAGLKFEDTELGKKSLKFKPKNN